MALAIKDKWQDIYEKKISAAGGLESYARAKVADKGVLLGIITKYAGQKGRIMEAGCGSAALASYLASKGHVTCGLDIDKDMLKLAKRVSAQFGSANRIRFIEGSVLSLPELGKFEVIFSNGVFEHFQDEQITLILEQQLKAASHVVFSVPSDFFTEEQRQYGNERFMPRRTWRELIAKSEGKIIEEFHFFDSPKTQKTRNQILLDRLTFGILPVKKPYIGFVVEQRTHSGNGNPDKKQGTEKRAHSAEEGQTGLAIARKGNIGLVVYGDFTIDEIITSGKTRANNGGSGYYSAVGASLFSKNVGVVGVVGNDYDLDALERLGIDREGIRMAPANKTTRFICRYSENLRDREIIEKRDASALAAPQDMPDRYLDQAQYFHVATMPPHQQEEMIRRIRSRNADAIISVDTIDFFIKDKLAEVTRVLELADTVFLDEEEYALVAGKFVPKGDLIIKCGPLGVRYTLGGISGSIAAPRIAQVVDKTGAGEMLAGAFMAQVADKANPEIALKNAVRCASESITDYGVEHVLAARQMRSAR